jgi:hypothetical protein
VELQGLFDLKESRLGGIKVGKALSQCHMDIKIQVKIQARLRILIFNLNLNLSLNLYFKN